MTDRRSAIIEAATDLFARQGLRGVAMDEIARQAGVAKPTLYSYFEGKDALFAAVCRSLGEAMISDAKAAAAQGSLTDRVYGILSAKFARTHALIGGSPHAQELLTPANPEARASIAKTEETLMNMLVSVLEGELPKRSGRTVSAREMAQRLMQAGHGSGYGVGSPAEQQASLRSLVELILE